MEQGITESLRIQAKNLQHTAGKHVADLLNNAADEIEKLRIANFNLNKGYDNAYNAINQFRQREEAKIEEGRS